MGCIPIDKHINESICNKEIANVLTTFQVGHIIVGHTPQVFPSTCYLTNIEEQKHSSNGINQTCDGRVFRVDIAGSKSFDFGDDGLSEEQKKNRIPQVLEIIDDKTFRILKKGHKPEVIYEE